MFNPKKTTPVQMDVVELGDLRPEEGGGLRKETLGRTRGLEALVLVLRGFAVPLDSPCRPEKEVARELADIFGEFCLSDLLPVENRLDRLKKEGKLATGEANLLKRVRASLEDGKPLRLEGLDPEEKRALQGYQFLTLFPTLVVVNVGEEGAGKAVFAGMGERCRAEGIGYLEVAGKTELELLDLPPEERAPFLADLGIAGSSRERLVAGVFGLLGLITFFTVGRTRCAGGRSPAGSARRARRGGSTATSSAASSAPRWCTTTSSSPLAAWRRRARPASCASKARSTSCGTATSATSALMYRDSPRFTAGGWEIIACSLSFRR
jgi:ribosome-binding ATPase YchF (GTP1/OBG family)